MELTVKYVADGVEYAVSESDGNIGVDYEELDGRHVVALSPKCELELKAVTLEMPYGYAHTDKIFLNGYQSWTDSKEFYATEKLHDLMRLPKALINKFGFDKYGDAHFKKYRRRVLHAFDLSYIVGDAPLSVFSLNGKRAHLIINHCVKDKKIVFEADVAGLRPDGEIIALDFYIGSESMGELAKRFFGEHDTPKLFGYTSWYNHYQNIDEQKMLYSLENLDKRFDLFQIDDGYETFVGDWLDVDEKKFPNGLDGIVRKIKEKGVKAGIWLAPFAAEKKSKLFAEHKDWLLKGEDGEPVFCGSNWSGFYALDIYNPEAREYIVKCLKHYADMGFDFFKLDFLYAACLVTPKNKTRAEVSFEAYKLLRDALGDKLILGCGAVMLPAVGLFDYMRIGPDVSLAFDDVLYMRLMHRERISTKVTVQNTVYRSFLNGTAFGNDPDVFLLRDGVKMTDGQKRSLTIVNALFGAVLMTSDDIVNYTKRQNGTLSEALELRNDATVKSYARLKSDIIIVLDVAGEEKILIYNTKSGEMING